MAPSSFWASNILFKKKENNKGAEKWCAPLLFANLDDRFSSVEAQLSRATHMADDATRTKT